MTLRSPSLLQQLLFGFGAILLTAIGAVAQDAAILTNGTQQAGKIIGCSPAGVQITVNQGSSITLPLASVKEVRMAPPAEFYAATRAMEAKNYDAALTALQIVDKFRGLPADWAQQAMEMRGEAFIEKGDMAKAEAAYADFQKLYPALRGNPQLDVPLARLAAAKKNFADAKSKVEPVVAKAAEDKNPSRASASLYSNALFVMGQVKESEGDFSGALDSYLKATTIFYQDKATAAQAQEKADALRKAHPGIFIP